jgi:hypothetical protein
MKKTFDISEALTVPAELNAIPWTEIEGQREFSQQLVFSLCGDDLSFQDTVFLGDLPFWSREERLTSLNFASSH